MSSELESVSLPAELLNEARDVACGGAVGSVSDYVAEAVRLRLAKDRALGQVTRLFGGPPPEKSSPWSGSGQAFRPVAHVVHCAQHRGWPIVTRPCPVDHQTG